MAMFNIHDYIMKVLTGMVGHYPDFQIMEYALNWYGRGKLTELDLAEVESWFESEIIEEDSFEEDSDIES